MADGGSSRDTWITLAFAALPVLAGLVHYWIKRSFDLKSQIARRMDNPRRPGKKRHEETE